MVPRPRNTANKNLPQNLYFDARRSTYRYRRPTDGKWFQFGTDRIKAIDAAKQLNLELCVALTWSAPCSPHRRSRSLQRCPTMLNVE